MARSHKKVLFSNSYKVEAYLKERFLNTRQWRARRDYLWSEGCVRTINLARFCCVCSVSLLHVLAPWALSVLEVVTVLLIYFLCTSRSMIIHDSVPKYHFSYFHSLEDVVGLACTRAVLLSIAYAAGMQHMHGPYLYASYLLAALCFPAILVKTILFRYTPDAVPAAVLFVITTSFCWLHVFAARRTVDWARRRYLLGLGGGSWWEEELLQPWGQDWASGTSSWGAPRRTPDAEEGSKASDVGGLASGLYRSGSEDVAPDSLADEDSKFVQVAGIQVHYKEVCPPPSSSLGARGGDDASRVGILLVHGFGAGVFAWRHVMEPLAMQCHCRVVAFDRPAFGLTSRPQANVGQPNPYTPAFQASLLLALCKALGLERVLIVAHADGCLLALRAASAALRSVGGHLRAPPARPLPAADARSSSLASPTSSPASATHPASSLAGASQPWVSGTPDPDGTPQAAGQAPDGGSGSGSGGGAGGIGGNVFGLHSPSAAVAGVMGPSISLASLTAAPRSSAEGSEAGGLGSGMGGDGSGHSRIGGMQSQSAAKQDSLISLLASEGTLRASMEVLPDTAWGSAGPQSVLGDVSSSDPYGASEGLGARIALPPGAVLDLSTGGVHHLGGAGLIASTAGSATTSGGGSSALRPPGLAPGPDGTRHRRVQSVPIAHLSDRGWAGPGGPAGAGGSAPILHAPSPMAFQHTSPSQLPGPLEEPQGPWPTVLGVALLHPNLSGVQGPTLSRLLARSRLGRSILRPLLRTELGEVANRRAWHNTHKLTPEVLELYKAPLRVEGWCESLIETTRVRRDDARGELTSYLNDARHMPCLLLTGEHDRVAPSPKVELLSADLPHSSVTVLPGCGHLSHEEVPGVLLATLVPFCGGVLDQQQQQRQQQQQQQQQSLSRGGGGLVQDSTALVVSVAPRASEGGELRMLG